MGRLSGEWSLSRKKCRHRARARTTNFKYFPEIKSSTTSPETRVVDCADEATRIESFAFGRRPRLRTVVSGVGGPGGVALTSHRAQA
eukprot:scaffold15050_cov66-Phaeocystis_antarctica.AAC.2